MITNRPIKILLITNSFILLTGAMLGPIYAIFVEQIGGSLLDASLAGGVFALAAGITVLISGRYTDKVKEPELIIVFGYVIVGFGFIMYVFVNSLWSLLLVQVIVGLGEAIYSPSFDAVYSQHLKKGRAGREWSLWEAMFYFTAAIGAIMGGIIVTYLGFSSLFTVMAILCFGSAYYIYSLPRSLL
ncbi:MAG: MFS transporter [bacterium]|nr:MFS transporter [bacterium]